MISELSLIFDEWLRISPPRLATMKPVSHMRWDAAMPMPQRRLGASSRPGGNAGVGGSAMVFPRAAAHDARQASCRGVAPISKMEEKTGVLSLLFVFWVAAFSTFVRPFFVELLFASFIATVSSYLKLKRLPRRGSSHIKLPSHSLPALLSACLGCTFFLSFLTQS